LIAMEVEIDDLGRAYIYERGSGGRHLRFTVYRTSARSKMDGLIAAIRPVDSRHFIFARADGTTQFNDDWLGWVLDAAMEGGWEP
jgi:hypothetical protein